MPPDAPRHIFAATYNIFAAAAIAAAAATFSLRCHTLLRH